MKTDPDITIVPATSPPSDSSGGLFTGGRTPLPADILDRARARVRVAAFSFAGLWVFVLVMNEGLRRILPTPAAMPSWNPAESVFAVIGLVLALAVAGYVGRCESNPTRAINIGLAFELATAVIVALISEWQPRTEPWAVSWVCIIILVYPSIAPASPRKTLFVALAAATTIPLALVVAELRGVDTNPSLFERLWLVLPVYICAFLAVVPANVIRTLTRQVSKARELGSYQLEELLGKGGMGEVYKAKHRLLARPAAVKLISPSALEASGPGAGRVAVERFRREAEAAATLRSPHTIDLYDYGVAEDGTFYYVMELLDGVDLQELVTRHGPLPAERVIHLMRQVCDSLGEAHQRGLVHRDVKPSNIFACRMGLAVDYVKVLDFGLVKKGTDAPAKQMTLTAEGSVSGTPAFMAPEAVSGGPVGPPADVYALGCVTYWLLTGRHVFTAPNPMMMMVQHIQAIPEPPSRKAPHPVPRDLDDLVLRCLAKEPAQRPPDAVSMAKLLDACSARHPWTDALAQEWWGVHSTSTLEAAETVGA
ncbi:MAG: serine/threonine protein kinase [Gemmatimonadaceae bacterium]|nr:serine/threonine protein kinase [Gemmatimonadaceae bacterium]